MTAIYGIWRFDGGDVSDDRKRLARPLSIYGKHGHQAWLSEPGLALGRHLHCTLPEDSPGEPVVRGSRYAVVADVRLTERADLIRQLGLGDECRSLSDSTLAAAAIETWHEGAFDRLYGAFAIAAWDTQERRLLLARDPLGHKPLFYHHSAQFFALASMPAGLHALPDIPRGPDIDSMKRFLALESPARGRTHFEAIGRVMPGHYATATASGVKESRYWAPNLAPLQLSSGDDYASALAERLDHAVAAALRGAGTEVGAHLSSGFDSTAVTTSAALQRAPSGGRVVAYTAAPAEAGLETLAGRSADESILASLTAAMHPNIEHVIIRSDRTPLANLDRTASIYGGPVLNICNETWFDAINDDAAHRGITIMLEGAMGNATISETGMLALPELLRSRRILRWAKLSFAINRRGTASFPATMWRSFGPLLPGAVFERISKWRHGALAASSRWTALKPEFVDSTLADAASEKTWWRPQAGNLPKGFIRPSETGVDERLALLTADDGGAAYKGILGEWGIDYRDPTADRRLIEFSLRVPTERLIEGGQPRALLRRVLAGRAPAEVLDNPRRGYQAADWHEWLNRARPEIVEEVARMEKFEPTSAILDVAELKALLADWPGSGSKAWTDLDIVADYRLRLLRAISAAAFMRQASGSNH